VSEAGDRAAIARSNAVELYELPGGRLLRTIPHHAAVSALAFANHGTQLVSGAVDGSVLIARDDSAQIALQASAGVDVVLVLPDGRMVVSDAQRRLRFYDAAGTTLADLETPVRLMSLRPQGSRLVAIPSDLGNAAPPLLLDLDRYHVIAQLEGHLGQVYSARWVAGERILTAGRDGSARLWSGATGQLVKIYQGGSRYLADATLFSDNVVVAGDADGVLRFWDLASGDRLWMLQAHKSAIAGIHVEGDALVTRGFTGEVSRWTLPNAEHAIDACGRHPHCAIVTR
jgi:WD40 repeat protein